MLKLLLGKEIELNVPVKRVHKAESPFLEVPVLVPEGVTRIDVSLKYDKSENCLVDIGILDSTATDFPSHTGFRGWSGGALEQFYVARDGATPGYYAGEMPEGIWKILLGLYVLPPEGAVISLMVKADDAGRKLYVAPAPVSARRDEAGWFRGDLHCHTYHSDAKGSPQMLAENARSIGLDFLSVTDHNTTSQWQYFGQESTPDLVFVPGMELTTYRGHANIFGLSDWIDFRIHGNQDLPKLVQEVRRQNAILSVNHDKEPLNWEYEYPEMDCMEVYHGHWLTGNDGVLKTYDQLLAEGRRISLIGGSDLHQPEHLRESGPFGLGKPTTVIWAPRLEASSVLEALKRGYGYVTESPTGPHLTFTVDCQPMGSNIRLSQTSPGQVEIVFEVRSAAGDRLVFVTEKGIVLDRRIPVDDWLDSHKIPAPRIFLRAEIVAEDSREVLIRELLDWQGERAVYKHYQQSFTDPTRILRALTNPVFFSTALDF